MAFFSLSAKLAPSIPPSTRRWGGLPHHSTFGLDSDEASSLTGGLHDPAPLGDGIHGVDFLAEVQQWRDCAAGGFSVDIDIVFIVDIHTAVYMHIQSYTYIIVHHFGGCYELVHQCPSYFLGTICRRWEQVGYRPAGYRSQLEVSSPRKKELEIYRHSPCVYIYNVPIVGLSSKLSSLKNPYLFTFGKKPSPRAVLRTSLASPKSLRPTWGNAAPGDRSHEPRLAGQKALKENRPLFVSLENGGEKPTLREFKIQDILYYIYIIKMYVYIYILYYIIWYILIFIIIYIYCGFSMPTRWHGWGKKPACVSPSYDQFNVETWRDHRWLEGWNHRDDLERQW